MLSYVLHVDSLPLFFLLQQGNWFMKIHVIKWITNHRLINNILLYILCVKLGVWIPSSEFEFPFFLKKKKWITYYFYRSLMKF